MSTIPAYRSLLSGGKVTEITEQLYEIASSCELCAHTCNVDRTVGEKGRCNSGLLPIVASYQPHFGEESPLVGRNGSGTIFFSNCNLGCIFCQNYDISHYGYGREIFYTQLAGMMMSLQERGCHNINLVSPSHMLYAIVRAVEIAAKKGLSLPIVYNTGGYDNLRVLALLEGVFDIYMPDIKYMDPATAEHLSGVRDYPKVVSEAVREMYRQVGDLIIDSRGIARKGLLVRHLILPNGRSQAEKVLDFIASLSNNTYVNIMDQYHPAFRAQECADLRRRITNTEFDDIINYAKSIGLHRLYT